MQGDGVGCGALIKTTNNRKTYAGHLKVITLCIRWLATCREKSAAIDLGKRYGYF